MSSTIEENATLILNVLANLPREASPMSSAQSGEEIADKTELSPPEINDAVAVLVESSLAEWLQEIGTAPFEFSAVWITPRGRYTFERMESIERQNLPVDQEIIPPVPIGSPFGFTRDDWEYVSEEKAISNKLIVVLGLKFESLLFNTNILKENIYRMLQISIDSFNNASDSKKIELVFRPLGAGYGEHLFNEIARDIISSDIAIFEISDLNPNVMIELGVALTWGVPVLLIKLEGTPNPPSDISGQTWAYYRENASVFSDHTHVEKMVRLIQRALRRKVNRNQ